MSLLNISIFSLSFSYFCLYDYPTENLVRIRNGDAISDLRATSSVAVGVVAIESSAGVITEI